MMASIRTRKVLILSSYCDAPGCTDEWPCPDCLPQGEVALAEVDRENFGGTFCYLKQLEQSEEDIEEQTMREAHEGYNVDYPSLQDLNILERDEVLSLLLKHLGLRIWRDSTPDYNELKLVKDE